MAVSASDHIGRVLADRYRLASVIGSGRTTSVFVAEDLKLDRRVAVKLAHPHLAEDELFVQRFHTEAQRTAPIVHPNLVAIFDWGVDGQPFLVTELCEGGSLEGVHRSGRTITPSQALVTALETARALEHAHNLGVVHGSVKPSNVLFDTNQRLRLSDLGLTSLTSASLAEDTVDSVRYLSPEQARGRPVDSPSDLYSLALTLNELVSGDRPPVDDSVVGTMMTRAESAAQVSTELAGLRGPLERCGRLDPADRPEAGELAVALLAAAETMPRPSALPLAGLPNAGLDVDQVTQPSNVDLLAEDEPVVEGEPEPTADDDTAPEVEVGTIAPTRDAIATAMPADTPSSVTEYGLLTDAAPVFAAPTAEPQLDVPDAGGSVRTAEARRRTVAIDDDLDSTPPRWPLLVLGLLTIAALAIGIFAYLRVGGDRTHTVPDLAGVTFENLGDAVRDYKWEVVKLENRQDGTVAGQIIDQSPGPGTELAEGEPLAVTVSLGNKMVEIPSDLTGLTLEQAQLRLGEVGLLVGEVAPETSEAVGEGLVIGISEPTTQKPTGDTVSLRISLGPQDRVVPETIVGIPIAEATEILAGLRLGVQQEQAYDDNAAPGIVLSVNPPAGSPVPADTAVTLFISAGPPPVPIPDVTGLSLEEAVDAITALGLVFADTEGTPGEPAIGTEPPAGEIADVGSEVVIILGDPDDAEATDGEEEPADG